MRSHLSKIVGKDEYGKVFGLVAVIDCTAPLVANFVFVVIFTATVDTFPGASFDAMAILLIVPLSFFMYIDLFCRKTIIRVNHNKNGIQLKDKANNRNGQQLTYITKAVKRPYRLTTEL